MAKAGAVTELLSEVLRLSARVSAAGDLMFADLGLSHARWQVLDALSQAKGATVADLARGLGVSRQAVQRVVNEMKAAGLVFTTENPRHRRAVLVQVTGNGSRAWELAAERRRAWAETLGASLPGGKVARMTERLRAIRKQLYAA